jgi:hypothetical protein
VPTYVEDDVALVLDREETAKGGRCEQDLGGDHELRIDGARGWRERLREAVDVQQLAADAAFGGVRTRCAWFRRSRLVCSPWRR